MNEQIEDTARFSRSENLVLEEIDDEVVILDLRNNVYFGLNTVAKLVWQQLDASTTVGAIVEEIAASFEVDRELVAKDVREFIADALANDLISPVTSEESR